MCEACDFIIYYSPYRNSESDTVLVQREGAHLLYLLHFEDVHMSKYLAHGQ